MTTATAEARTETDPLTVTCHKGTGSGDTKTCTFAGNTMLAQARKQLEQEKFLMPDEEGKWGYRFVNPVVALRKDLSPEGGGLIQPNVEDVIPVRKVLRNNHLMVTNIEAARSDLIGIRAGYFEDDNLFVRVRLNQGDGKEANDEVGAFAPIMMSNVRPTQRAAGAGFYDNVCVVVQNSIVEFDICSFAAAGFEEKIEPGIITGVALCQPGKAGYMTSTISRYQSSANTIKITGAEEANIPSGRSVRFQRVTFTTRRLTEYTTLDGKTIKNDAVAPDPRKALPPVAQQDDEWADDEYAAGPPHSRGGPQYVQLIPGSAIKTGGPVKGGISTAEFGGVQSYHGDPFTQALGQITVYFFVFASLDEARKVIDSYSAPETTSWD